MRYTLSALLLFLLSLAIGLSACDSGGAEEDEVDNQFSFTIEPTSSGSATVEQEEELNGHSFFVEAEDSETGEEVFAIYLNDEDSFSDESATQGLFGWIGRDASRPGTGEYAFNSDGETTNTRFGAIFWEDIQNTQTAPFYIIDSGTVTLSESSDGKVSGSVDASGRKLIITSSGTAEEPVRISGSFTAEDVDTFVPLSGPTP